MGIEKLIQERRREAIDKNICEKADVVAKYLGRNNRPMNNVYSFLFNEDGIGISIYFHSNESYTFCGRPIRDGSWRETKVSFKKEVVFSEKYGDYTSEQGITTFIPGKWERRLDRLYKKALVVEEEQIQKQRQRKKDEAVAVDQKKRKQWGL